MRNFRTLNGLAVTDIVDFDLVRRWSYGLEPRAWTGIEIYDALVKAILSGVRWSRLVSRRRSPSLCGGARAVGV
jgi:hypothetical protein